MIGNLTLETPSGYTFTFTIYNLYNFLVTAPVPFESLVGFSGSAGMARSLTSWLGLDCSFVWKRLWYIMAVSLTEQIFRSEFNALLEIY
jgi:hypothetical protein